MTRAEVAERSKEPRFARILFDSPAAWPGHWTAAQILDEWCHRMTPDPWPGGTRSPDERLLRRAETAAAAGLVVGLGVGWLLTRFAGLGERLVLMLAAGAATAVAAVVFVRGAAVRNRRGLPPRKLLGGGGGPLAGW
jgi:hypothetical protein